MWMIMLLLITGGCKKGGQSNTSGQDQMMEQEIDTSSLLLKYNDNLFSLPSPYQAAYIIREHDVPFDKTLLNDPQSHTHYTTSFKKALNIGVYGTDLGYLNIFNGEQESLAYFNVMKKLANDLGLQNAFSAGEFEKLRESLVEGDSMLYYLSRSYRKFDAHLKEHNRKKTGALILAGGWIESNYILSQTVLQSQKRPLVNRLGEQKHALDNLIDLLSSYYYEAEKYTELIDQLVDIAYEFDGVIYNYYYKEPVVKEKQKLTIIRSNSNVVISEYHLRTIAEKLRKLRNKVIS
jgi:hypothetical protein